MGIFDNMATGINKGAAAAERTAKTVSIKNKMNELQKRRKDLMSQLGASLYDAVKADEQLIGGRESILAAIEKCDGENNALRQQLQELERMATEEAAASRKYECPHCGAPVCEADHFCCGCGKPAEDALRNRIRREGAGVNRCPECSAAVSEGDLFCMTCGTRLEEAREDVLPVGEGVIGVDVCGNCGTPRAADGKFCMNCGVEFPSSDPSAA